MNARVRSLVTVVDYSKWFLVVALIAAAVVGNYYFREETVSLLYRFLGVVFAMVLAIAIGLTTQKGKAVNRLRKEAWSEVRKVVWPTKQETTQVTLVVVAVVVVVAILLWGIDLFLSWLISFVIG